MDGSIQNYQATPEACAELVLLNRKKFSKFLPYIAVLIIGAIAIIQPKVISYKDEIQPIIGIIAMLVIFFGFMYWYFGSSKFVTREYDLQIIGTHVKFLLGEMIYENPKTKIISELDHEYIIEIKNKIAILIPIPKEIYNSSILNSGNSKQ